MTALSINLNKIALIRNSREGNYPNILDFANTCIDCGVDGITVHPRPDQRHIRPTDVRQLAQLVAPPLLALALARFREFLLGLKLR